MTRTLLASGYGGKIYSLAFDEAAKSLTVTGETDAGAAPTWCLKHPKFDVLYTGDEFAPKDGVLSAFKLDRATGQLELLATTASAGEGPVHLVLSPSHEFLYVANYAGATVSSIKVDRSTGLFAQDEPAAQSFKFSGSGPREDRQEAPHPHGVFLDPTGALLFCADLGSDKLRVWLTGSELTQLPDIDVAPGAGPRHLVFAPATKVGAPTLMYLVEELSNVIDVYELVYPTPADKAASLKPVQLGVSILPTNQEIVPNSYTGAELAFTPDHSHLLVSNRAPDDPLPKNSSDVWAIFPVLADGTLGEVAFKEIGGRGPRHFEISGDLIAVGTQKTDEVIVWGLEGGKVSESEVARVGGVNGVTWVSWL